MSNIVDYPFSFSLVRNYVVFTFKRYYGENIVTGRENVPENCPVIFAPNHINALMDAIAVHSIAPYHVPVVFLARADIFKNKTAAKILKFMKILPAFRMRDGIENLSKNNEIFEQCVEILHKNNALGIMPEGNQGEQRKLRPFVKGIFRIAFDTQQKYSTLPNVKIVPVGIDYGDLAKFGKHIIINIGKPIEVSDYMLAYGENPVTATNEIREKLKEDLNQLSLNLATEKYYDCFLKVTEVANTSFLEQLLLPDNTISRFEARQEIAKRLVLLEKTDPEKMKSMESVCTVYTGLLNKLKLHNRVLEQEPAGNTAILTEGFKLLMTLPVFVVGFLCNFIPFFLPMYIRKSVIKAQYEGFFSTLQYGIGIIIFPLFYLIQALFFTCVISASWWTIILFFFIQYPFGKWALKWNSKTTKFRAKLRYRHLMKEKSPDLNEAQKMRIQIIRMIS